MPFDALIGYDDDDDVSGTDWVGDDDDDDVGADDDALALLDAAVSGTDWVGQDDDDYVGARRRRPRFKMNAFRKAISRVGKQNMRMKKALRARRLGLESKAGMLPQIFLGVDSGVTNINAGATAAVSSEPNVDMRITDLIVDDANAASFRITQIAATRVSMMASGDGVPATMFLSGVQRPPIRVPRVPAGTNVVTTVVNRSGAAARFEGGYIGIDLTHRGI